MNDSACQLKISPTYRSYIRHDMEEPSKDELIRKTVKIPGISVDDAFVEASRLPPDIRDDAGSLVRMYRRNMTEEKRMAALTLDYRCYGQERPLYIKHIEVEHIAVTAYQQLVADSIDAVSFDALRQISGMRINGIDFALEISTDCAVHDKQGNHTFGVRKFDPAMSNTATVSISSVGESLSKLLALSAPTHELGHAVFNAPGWVVQGSKGPGLFDDTEPTMQRVCRTTTPGSDHLSKSLSVRPTTEEHFVEPHASEFTGSLLVPRQRIVTTVEELVLQHDITIHRHLSADPDHPGMTLRVKANGDLGVLEMDRLEKALVTCFGVSPRFIQARLNRYGPTTQETTMR